MIVVGLHPNQLKRIGGNEVASVKATKTKALEPKPGSPLRHEVNKRAVEPYSERTHACLQHAIELSCGEAIGCSRLNEAPRSSGHSDWRSGDLFSVVANSAAKVAPAGKAHPLE
jgi:hypothetical protein